MAADWTVSISAKNRKSPKPQNHSYISHTYSQASCTFAAHNRDYPVVYTHEIHAHESHAYKVHACEVHAYVVHAHEAHVYEAHVYEVHAHEAHAYEVRP